MRNLVAMQMSLTPYPLPSPSCPCFCGFHSFLPCEDLLLFLLCVCYLLCPGFKGLASDKNPRFCGGVSCFTKKGKEVPLCCLSMPNSHHPSASPQSTVSRSMTVVHSVRSEKLQNGSAPILFEFSTRIFSEKCSEIFPKFSRP